MLVHSLSAVTTAETGGFDVMTVLNSFKEAISSVISVDNIVKVIVAGVAIAVPFIVTWFGFRFVYSKAKGGFKKGK